MGAPTQQSGPGPGQASVEGRGQLAQKQPLTPSSTYLLAVLGPRTSGRVTSLVRLLPPDCTRIRSRKRSPRLCPPEPPSGTGPGRAHGGPGHRAGAGAPASASCLRLPVGAGAGGQGSKPGWMPRQARGGRRGPPGTCLVCSRCEAQAYSSRSLGCCLGRRWLGERRPQRRLLFPGLLLLQRKEPASG